MIICYVGESSGIQPVVWPDKFFYFFCIRMGISEFINCAVQANAFLNAAGKIVLLFPFYKITDHIAHGYFGMMKRKPCMGKIIHDANLCKVYGFTKIWFRQF